MAPSFKARAARVYGQRFRVTRYADNVDWSRGADVYEVTVLEDADKKYTGGGMRFGALTMSGIADASVSTSFGGTVAGSKGPWQQNLATVLGSSSVQIWTAAIMGDAIGSNCWMFKANQTDVSMTAPCQNRVAANIAVQPSSAINLGKLHLAGTSTLTSTGSQTAVVGAATALGGVVHYHLTDVTTAAGSTVATFKVVLQQSSNGAAWADIAGTSSTFSGAGQARTGQSRYTISGAIKAQTRINVSAFTGGVSRKVSIACAFARSSQ